MSKLDKLKEFDDKIANGLTKRELIELRKKVYNVKVELYSEEWYEKQNLLKCIKEFIDEDETDPKEQVKKEWEELGYEWIENDTTIVITDRLTTTITINLTRKYYICASNDSLTFQCVSLEEHQLLTKTFKALGWK